MSLVIATNNDEDTTMRQGQSIASAYSFRNSLSSVYKIPPNSQVCLQSAKVNLDGRINLTLNNSTYYDWFNSPLVENPDGPAIDLTTGYPILQEVGVANQVLELTTDEIAERIQLKHKEHHPNRMLVPLKVEVDREANGTGFNGYKLTYTQKEGDGVKRIPSTWKKCGAPTDPTRFTWDDTKAMFQRIALDANADEYNDPSVGMGINYPLDLSEGKLEVDFSSCAKDQSDCPWGVGMSRCNLNSIGRMGAPGGVFAPNWFGGLASFQADGSHLTMTGSLSPGAYYEDFGVHKNEDDELVLRHATCRTIETATRKSVRALSQGYKEVKYWTNTKSHFKDLTKRYVFDAADAYTKVRYVALGEQVEVYLVKDDGTAHLITKYDAAEAVNSYFKPVSQTCWTLHPVLYVGPTAQADEGILAVIDYDGADITKYDPEGVDLVNGVRGWYEEAQLPSIVVGERINRFCMAVDMRQGMNSGRELAAGVVPYAQKGLDGDNMIDSYISAIITSPNELYAKTPRASSSKLFGFNGRSFVTQAATIDAGGAQLTILTSDSASYPVQSIFVRLNGFGQQVLNARTGNKSTILAHLPTADSRGSIETRTRFFYEPNRDIWIDLNNPFELQTTEFGLDFVYSTEQYAKILSGQSIVVLYFREKPKTE
tara:strand:- start:1348 stop:3312 length:1965 start_codon:yes stop_codon:yes gene_type:complete